MNPQLYLNVLLLPEYNTEKMPYSDLERAQHIWWQR